MLFFSDSYYFNVAIVRIRSLLSYFGLWKIFLKLIYFSWYRTMNHVPELGRQADCICGRSEGIWPSNFSIAISFLKSEIWNSGWRIIFLTRTTIFCVLFLCALLNSPRVAFISLAEILLKWKRLIKQKCKNRVAKPSTIENDANFLCGEYLGCRRGFYVLPNELLIDTKKFYVPTNQCTLKPVFIFS